MATCPPGVAIPVWRQFGHSRTCDRAVMGFIASIVLAGSIDVRASRVAFIFSTSGRSTLTTPIRILPPKPSASRLKFVTIIHYIRPLGFAVIAQATRDALFHGRAICTFAPAFARCHQRVVLRRTARPLGARLTIRDKGECYYNCHSFHCAVTLFS
jgi:hypothetical protein